MSRGALQDTVTDFEVGLPGGPSEFHPLASLVWAGTSGATLGASWLVSFSINRFVWMSDELDAELRGGRIETVALYGVGGAIIGLGVGGLRLALVRRLFWNIAVEVLALAMVTGVTGALCPLVTKTAPAWLPPLVASTLVWTAGGAVIGFGGYTWGRGIRSVDRHSIETDNEDRGSRAAAIGWATAIGVSCAGMWLIELVLLRLLPDPVRLGRFFAEHVPETAGVLALSGGVIGFVVGMLSGLFVGRPPRLAAGLYRGIGFANAAAIGGALVPFVVSATGGWLAPEMSSTLVWAVVGAVAGAVGYAYSRRDVRSGGSGDDSVDGPPVAPVANDRPAPTPPPPARPGILPGDATTPEPVEEPVAVLTGWDPVPDEKPGHGSPVRVGPVPPAHGGIVVRVGPVLLVSAGCLLAVALSAPSPVGWAMLAIGLMGLAVTWGLAGQERRIRELESRLRERRLPPEGRSTFPDSP